jgi:hypothetical protein
MAAAAALLLAACAPGAAETSFAYDEPIPIGPATLRVVRAETVPRNAPQLNSLHPAEGQQAAAVFVRWSGLENLSDAERYYWVEALLKGRSRLREPGGRTHRAVTVLPRQMYQGQAQVTPRPPQEWVVIFHFPAEVREWTYLLENPAPEEAQPRLAAVRVAP